MDTAQPCFVLLRQLSPCRFISSSGGVALSQHFQSIEGVMQVSDSTLYDYSSCTSPEIDV